MRPLLILAGGFGTRLSSVVKEAPKPLAPVCGAPFLKYILINCIEQGVTDIVLLLHYKAEQFEEAIRELQSSGNFSHVRIRSVIESKPLGTGGSVIHAVNKLDSFDSFMVINADTWLGEGLRDLNKSGSNSLLAVSVRDCSRYGSLRINNGLVKEFMEKKLSKYPGWINAGAYCLTSDVLTKYQTDEYTSMELDVLPELVRENNLKVVKTKSNFIDIGIPEDYFKFCNWIELGRNHDL
jgi:D-glycero-alpha-D-manno-heptose 1-phosphate guanylyltransferase